MVTNQDPDHRTTQDLRNDEELRQNSPVLEWMLMPNTGGLRVAIYVYDPPPGVRPPCSCNVFGSPRRKPGPHHEEKCGRYVE